ncbi:hypothetical protein PACTADRAFT_2996 [Pachysolen tannophilus NRRL Y-2460]|uniref:Dynamin-type G domain-containing protein n=1 Tax=Pachysolen tannophilus NRRL Y-2460 TaxID=669874 RepID=A0A1E4TU13_PACTA|nr:hypothetical protein PACTADRAFT_2996 [Pachysolen tannophilus NRRL Y-2460]
MSEEYYQKNGNNNNINGNGNGYHNNNNVDHEEDYYDDSKTLITADELINSLPDAKIMYSTGRGLEDDSTTLINGNGSNDNKFIQGSSSKNRVTSNNRQLKTHIQQLQYNDNKVALDRSINASIEILNELRTENKERPIYYPTVINDNNEKKLNSKKSHLALFRQNSFADKKLSETAIPDENFEDGEIPEFKILNINIRLDHFHRDGGNFITNLDKESLASLLDEKIALTIKHLLALKDRIDDTSSKVFVTGDLNSGKSAFCNALLRKKLLPEDEQPCTNVFCEVIDARDNNGLEEIHAVPIGSHYDIKDESTYKIFPLKDIDDLVYQSDTYAILKIYCNDNRPIEQSLLKNGIIDISLIDAPGLNMDSYQTTQVFSRQEEIDLVVFVVDAKNHFTLSGKEFISSAANEKNLIFIVINKFDSVKDKDKCMRKILDQVQSLSPDTHKDARDFVHFVSSNNIQKDNPGDGDGPGNDPDDNGGGDAGPDDPDFDHLEACLRNFILEKRSLSKLLPSKNYLFRLLSDLEVLFKLNEQLYSKEKEEMIKELNEIMPKYESAMQRSVKINDAINKIIENTATDVYNYSKKTIDETIAEMNSENLIEYSGLKDLYQYSVELQQAMINKLAQSVVVGENYARKKTTEKVEVIKQIGSDELGSDFYTNRVFRDELMFSRKKDSIQKKLKYDISILDFFDPSFENFAKAIGFKSNTPASSSSSSSSIHSLIPFTNLSNNQLMIWKNSASALAVYSATKFFTNNLYLLKNFVSVSDLFRVEFLVTVSKPLLIFAGMVSVSYLILDMPNSFQRKTAKKIAKQINELNYPHLNSLRISKEVRTVLNIPSREVLNSFQTSIDKAASRKEKIVSSLKSSDASFNFYNKTLKSVLYQKKIVESFNLENVNQVD